MEHILKILSVSHVTHDVRCIRLEKPDGYVFTPGQATEAAVNKDGWASEKRPFTFTCLNEDPYLEFTIKCYNDHDGVTNQIGQLKPGDELIIDDPGALSVIKARDILSLAAQVLRLSWPFCGSFTKKDLPQVINYFSLIKHHRILFIKRN